VGKVSKADKVKIFYKQVFGKLTTKDEVIIEQGQHITELNQKIKYLEHRLSNCIEPKFKIGQEVCFIDWDRQIRIGKVEDISYFSSRDSIEYEIGYSNGYDEDESDWFGEKIIYTTKEEAKAKLEKIKDGNL
jgi:hypothetical protein